MKNMSSFLLTMMLCVIVPAWTHATAQDSANPSRARSAERERRLAPLVATGIDMDSVDALVGALDSKNSGVQIAAMSLLGEKQARSAIPKVRSLIESAWPFVSLTACDT